MSPRRPSPAESASARSGPAKAERIRGQPSRSQSHPLPSGESHRIRVLPTEVDAHPGPIRRSRIASMSSPDEADPIRSQSHRRPVRRRPSHSEVLSNLIPFAQNPNSSPSTPAASPFRSKPLPLNSLGFPRTVSVSLALSRFPSHCLVFPCTVSVSLALSRFPFHCPGFPCTNRLFEPSPSFPT